MKIDDIKQSVNSLWTSATEGWRRLKHSAADSLTLFKPVEIAQAPRQGRGARLAPGRHRNS